MTSTLEIAPTTACADLEFYLGEAACGRALGFVVFDDPEQACTAEYMMPMTTTSLGEHIKETAQDYDASEQPHSLKPGIAIEFCGVGQVAAPDDLQEALYYVPLQPADAGYLRRQLPASILMSAIKPL